MQVLKITVREDGSVEQFTPDFKVMRGSYRNVLLNMEVPHSLLLDPVNDTDTGENQTGNNVRIGAIIRTATGHNLQTKRYDFKRVKDYQRDGKWFRLYQRRMPKEFTMWETVNLLEATNNGIVEMVINVLNWTKDSSNRNIEEVAASPIFHLDIYPSAFLDNAEEIEEPSNFDELHSQVQEMDADLDGIQSDLYGTLENNLGDYLPERLKAGNKITIEEDLTQLPNGKLKISVQEIRANEVPIDPIFELDAEDVQEALIELSQRTDSILVKTVTGESEGLVDNKDPINPIILHDATKADVTYVDGMKDTIVLEIQPAIDNLQQTKADKTEVDSKIAAHNTNSITHMDIRLNVDTIEAIARGRMSARVFTTELALDTWLATLANAELLNIGDNFYIVDTNVPDFWWDGTQKQPLEAEKVDLSDYYTKVQSDALLNSKIDKIMTSNHIYGTDENGNQITYDAQSFMTEIKDGSITNEKLNTALQESIAKANSAIQTVLIDGVEQEIDENGVVHLDIPESGVSRTEMEEYVTDSIENAIGTAINGGY